MVGHTTRNDLGDARMVTQCTECSGVLLDPDVKRWIVETTYNLDDWVGVFIGKYAPLGKRRIYCEQIYQYQESQKKESHLYPNNTTSTNISLNKSHIL